MPLHVNGILADANCEGHLALLWRLFQEGCRHDVWEALHLTPISLADLGLYPDASDRAVWEARQREQVILLTANRNDAGPDSLEATIQQYTRLPVSPSSRWPMSSEFYEIGCMPQRLLIGGWCSCVTLTGIAGPDGCTCPKGVGNGPAHNAFGNFDHTGSYSIVGRRQRETIQLRAMGLGKVGQPLADQASREGTYQG